MISARFSRGAMARFAMVAILVASISGALLIGGYGSPKAESDYLPPPSSIGSAAWVQFEGIEGESLDVGHVGWSAIVAFNNSYLRTLDTAAGPIPRRGDAELEDILVIKELDKASPRIAEALLKGKAFSRVYIDIAEQVGDSGQEVYYQYELKNARVTRYNIGSTGQDGITPLGLPAVQVASVRPVDEIAIYFEEVKVTYTLFGSSGSPEGTVEYSWKREPGT